MIIRREIAKSWATLAEQDGTLHLERSGSKLIGAGDEEIWRRLLSMGFSVLVTDRLEIQHDLPNERFGWRYLWRLNYWMSWSYAWLDYIDSRVCSTSGHGLSMLQCLRHLKLLLCAATKEQRIGRWMDWACSLGRIAGMRAAVIGHARIRGHKIVRTHPDTGWRGE